MQRYTKHRQQDSADALWVLEHKLVMTHGNRQSIDINGNEPFAVDSSIPQIYSNRGGESNIHSPGQIMFYLLADLRRIGLGVRELVQVMLHATRTALADLNISTHERFDEPGLYIDSGEKVAFIGLRLSRGCSYHGMCLNFDNDLSIFADYPICGVPNRPQVRVTDIAPEVPKKILIDKIITHWLDNLYG